MTSAQRKVLIVRNANWFDFGGGERFPVDLAVEIAKHGWQPLIISRNDKLLAYAEDRDVTYQKGWWWSRQNWGGTRTILLPLHILWQLILTGWYIKLILRHHADVLHLQSRDDFIAGTLAGKLLRKRIVWTDHADLKYVYANNQTWYKNFIGKLVYFFGKRANAIAIVSRKERELIRKSVGHKLPENYLIIHNGVPATPVKADTRPVADGSATVFAVTSRLVTAKGIGELIEAFNLLRQEDEHVRLWIFGEGPEEDKFKDLAAGNEDIVFHGFVRDPLPQLATADVFVHPSYNEAFSLSLIEAAKLGLPIIACKVGGNPEIVTDRQNGLLIPARDSRALYEAMKKLAGNRTLRLKMGAEGEERYHEEFEFETIVKEKYLPLYED